MLRVSAVLLLLGFAAVQASPAGIRVSDNMPDEVEDDEDWSMSARESAKLQSIMDEKEILQMRQKARVASQKDTMTEADVSEFAELADEVDTSVMQMKSQLTQVERMSALQKRWKELAAELHAARVEEFMDGIPEMPKTMLGLQAEVARLENVRKVEGLDKVAVIKPQAPKKASLLQTSVSASKFESVARMNRLNLVQKELVDLQHKIASADAALAHSMEEVKKATLKQNEAEEALYDSQKLWQESQKELRGRDRDWAQKERAHIEEHKAEVDKMQRKATQKLVADQALELELTGQQMLTAVSAALQEAGMDRTSVTQEAFTNTLKSELEKNEFEIGDFMHYAKTQTNPMHLPGWALFKRGPAGVAAEPIAKALRGLDSSADADQLAAKLYQAL